MGYDAESLMLEIEFTRGVVYRYYNVPAEQYERLKTAESIGRYFDFHIKGKYEYEQISTGDRRKGNY